MGRIHKLPPGVVSRIAAGEVVERPASVIKELVENALDAGATQVAVTASMGGLSLRVADNGSGITPDDLPLAFENHATSKLNNTPEDGERFLTHVSTLGFRGEALASISAIARVTCTTRTADMADGLRVLLNPAAPTGLTPTPAPCAQGTIFEVDDLFFNVPVRRQFLKKPTTELAHVEEAVQQLALSRPDVRFTLTLNDTLALNTPGNGDIPQTLQGMYNLPADLVAEHLLPLDFADDANGFQLSGWAASPAAMKLHRQNKKFWHIYVNGRSVRCPVALKAIEAAYHSLVPERTYPLVVLCLTLPGPFVDVNVHPTKREVRYQNNGQVFNFIFAGIRRALSHLATATLIGSPATQSTTPGAVSPAPYGAPIFQTSFQTPSYHRLPGSVSAYQNGGMAPPPGTLPALNGLAHTLQAPLQLPTLPDAAIRDPAQPEGPPWRVIGQLFNTYILLETVQGLMVVDQHIASERAWFERFSRQTLHEQTAPSQQLLTPHDLALSPSQRELLAQHADTLAALGFSLGFPPDAPETVHLQAIPAWFPNATHRLPDVVTQLMDLLGDLEHHGHLSTEDAATHQTHQAANLLATMACHRAVRAGDPLTHADMETVVADWLACTLPWSCPHGRPIAHTLTSKELNAFFDRPSLPKGF